MAVRDTRPVAAPNAEERELAWHEVECCSYRADLALWSELAGAAAPPGGRARVLDVGAGSGRVALALATEGHEVTALDISPVLLRVLGERAASLPVRTVLGDAREIDIDGRPFDLVIVPMQTVQLLHGSDEREALMRGARAHLRPGGRLALTIVTEFDTFDSHSGDPVPMPDQQRREECLYVSRPVRVLIRGEAIEVERRRLVLGPDASPWARSRTISCGSSSSRRSSCGARARVPGCARCRAAGSARPPSTARASW